MEPMEISKEKEFLLRRWSDLSDIDWYILGPVLVLIFFNALLLQSALQGKLLSKQLFFLLPAFLIGISILFIRIKFWRDISIWVYVLNLFLLIFVLLKGTPYFGAQRWLTLGFIKIQPSEVAKIAIIVSLASWFVKRPIKSYVDLFISALIVIPPFLLVFKQPDLGTSLVFVVIFLGMAFWAGATMTYLLVSLSPLVSLLANAVSPLLISLGYVHIKDKLIELTVSQLFIYFLFFLAVWLVISYKPWKSPLLVLWISFIVFMNFLIGFSRPILWNLLHPYQQKRLMIFLNPESDPLGAGYHIIQSILAIGNGGLFGYGWQNGRLTKGNYVPAQHTDFVFSIAGEEFGFIGAVFLVLTFALLLSRIVYISKHSNDKFSSLVAIGIFSFFSFHIFVNIGMTLGIMPITGVPLPFLSYGGTALFVDLFLVFLLLSISWRTLPKKIF